MKSCDGFVPDGEVAKTVSKAEKICLFLNCSYLNLEISHNPVRMLIHVKHVNV